MPAILRILTILTVIVFSALTSFSQQIDLGKLDNNPKLTPEESAWLNNHINRGDFDFTGKYVAFSELLTGGFYGIGKFMLPLHKKHVFIEQITTAFYQLYVLNEDERKQTNGYDAIIVVGDKKHKGKMRRLTREAVIADNFNRYPQIPAGAGEDNNPVLSEVNAKFFNEIYKRHTIAADGFDFSGKKIAIFDTQCRFDKIEQRTISQFVSRVRSSLDQYALYNPEYTYILTEQQKIESGGYDLIIQYRCKMDMPLQSLLDKLKTAGK